MSASDLATAVKQARHDQRLTQEDVESRGGPSVASLRTIEKGLTGSYRPRTLRSLEVALGWPVGAATEVLTDGEMPDSVGGAAMPDWRGPIADILEALAGRLRQAGRFILDQNNDLKDDNARLCQALNQVRDWCDKTYDDTSAWMDRHNPDCHCDVGPTYLECVEQVRRLLPEDDQDPSWRVVVSVPLTAPDRDGLFTAVADAVHAWEPVERDGWDADVSTEITS